MKPHKSSLVIVYHRAPYQEVVENGKTYYRDHKSPNGILPTLKGFFDHVDRGTWVATKQVSPKQKERHDPHVTVDDGTHSYHVRQVPLTADEIKQFYHITSKEAFWPILHSFPNQFKYDGIDWDTFVEVNKKFADAACDEAADDAMIWIHDYNLWLVPYFVRERMPNARIGFFHHTPFPAADVFNILPWREQIVESLLSCDIVGFHIPRYAENFVGVARSLRAAEIVRRVPVDSNQASGKALSESEVTRQIRYKDRIVNIDTYSVGTNPEQIRDVLHRDESEALEQEIREEIAGRKLIVSVSRVDYVKGTREMLESFGRVLERRPDLHGKVQLLVTAVSAASGMRAYRTAQQQIEQLVGRINGRFAKLNWTPIFLYTQPIPFEKLLCYYRVADVCWVPPLRDGLNLVAKEYVAAHAGRDGVLLLSEFVGAAVDLPDAVFVNPYSDDSMDKGLEAALEMPREEQGRRMTKLYRAVVNNSITHWADHTLQQFRALQAQPDTERKAG
ncbi:glucosylglycerol-phosphate synthase [Ectothiorhodospiraceae bacterium 2226]|nr:glucosylglycerol-phosphate synthase [Ectothiorhodospiraceae bacterium 2226]